MNNHNEQSSEDRKTENKERIGIHLKEEKKN